MKRGFLLKTIFLLVILVIFSLILSNNVKSQGWCTAKSASPGPCIVDDYSATKGNHCDPCYPPSAYRDLDICRCNCLWDSSCSLSPPCPLDKCPYTRDPSIYYDYYEEGGSCSVFSEICSSSNQCQIRNCVDPNGNIPLTCYYKNSGKFAKPEEWTWGDSASNSESREVGGCSDNFDNDCDGLIDNNDPDCGCILSNVRLIPQCSGGVSTDCETSENINIEVTYNGACAGTKYIQVDANDTSLNNPNSCNIQNSGGDMIGLNHSITMQNVIIPNIITTSWTIPTIASDCVGKTIYPRDSALYNNPIYNPTTEVSRTSNLQGNFKFIGSATNSCSDTDNGQNNRTQGTITGIYNSIPYSYTDSCQGNTLREYYCNLNNNESVTVNCAAEGLICQNGACIPSGQTCTEDTSDGGSFDPISIYSQKRPAYFKGNVNVTNSSGSYLYNDDCNNGVLKEYRCNGNNPEIITYVCPFGCQDSFTCKVTCTETDSPSANPTQQGTATGLDSNAYRNFSAPDVCSDGTNLNEIFCTSDNFLNNTIINCSPGSCVNGACTIPPQQGNCYTDRENIICDQSNNEVCCNITSPPSQDTWECRDISLCTDNNPPEEDCESLEGTTCCTGAQTCNGNLINPYTCTNGGSCCVGTCDTTNFYTPDYFDVLQVSPCTENPPNSGNFTKLKTLTTHNLSHVPEIVDVQTELETCTPLRPANIPFFTTLNIILVIIILISFYLFRKTNKS